MPPHFWQSDDADPDKATAMVEAMRRRRLDDSGHRRGRYVLYWMQQSQRAAFNHALNTPSSWPTRWPAGAGRLRPDGRLSEANVRHYASCWRVSGRREALAERGINFVIRHGAPDVSPRRWREAALVVCDRGYLRHQKAWRAELARRAPCAVVEVEGDVVVPLEVASGIAEFAARTLRPKLQRVWDEYLRPLEDAAVHKSALDLRIDGASTCPISRACWAVYSSIARSRRSVASRAARAGAPAPAPFLAPSSTAMPTRAASPRRSSARCSAPICISARSRRSRSRSRCAQPGSRRCRPRAYLEELIVRRELAVNFVEFESRYDDYACLPGWARGTLDAHRADRRPHIYTREQLESARTHDRYWNAAMQEMRDTGFMHNYMRMYWAKKILEWCADPRPPSRPSCTSTTNTSWTAATPFYANVAWVFGLHDRPWPERPVFGKVRYMNAKGSSAIRHGGLSARGRRAHRRRTR